MKHFGKPEEKPKEKTVAQLEKEVANWKRKYEEEARAVIAALRERDQYGLKWRHFEILCNQNNCWESYGNE
jgi:hypothetical protein